MNTTVIRPDIESLYMKRAVVIGIAIHALLMLLRFSYTVPEVKPRTDAIELTVISKQELQRHKMVRLTSKAPVSEPITRPVPKKVISGTQKVVKDSTTLGNPKEKTVRQVQKGDPMSKKMTKYKPGTEFRKLSQTNIGSGSGGNKTATDAGGGSGNKYQGPDFAFKSDMGRPGERFKIKGAADDLGAGAGKGAGIGDGMGKGYGDGSLTGTPNGTLKKAAILDNVGSLTGVTNGVIGPSKGAQGLSRKGTLMLAGIPEETQILGSMDPSIIRRILVDHLPQFRYCYQKELEARDKPMEVQGVLQLDFKIVANGSVQNAQASGGNSISNDVKGCVAGVLRGIQFPKPLGGGSVEVKQPLNFYPKNQ